MEEDYEPSVQSQRRVNPKIHDVIKKEVEKLLDAGLIYPISDSPWVSLYTYVPKKEEGIVLDTKFLSRDCEVDRAKVEVIAKLPIDFLSKGPVVPWHCRIFTERFNQDFSKLPVLLLLCLKKDSTFSYSEEFNECPFNTLKRKYVTEDPILIAPSGTCLVNDVAMLIDFRQWGSPRKEKQAFPTYTRMLARL
ncbi:hypothetical protein Tco_0012572 [Tanacetum coccineum]